MPVTTSIAKPPRKRTRDAFERSVAVFRTFRERATPEEMERIAAHLEQALTPIAVSPERASLLSALTGGKFYTEQERLELEAAHLARAFGFRRDLLADSLTAPQVAALLGTTRQTPHDRAKAGTLLAVRDRGGLRFPHWQFDPDAPDGVVSGLGTVLKALAVSPLEQAAWFVRPQLALDGETPMEALKAGDLSRLLPLARAVGGS